jgi:hypothetical protein
MTNPVTTERECRDMRWRGKSNILMGISFRGFYVMQLRDMRLVE